MNFRFPEAFSSTEEEIIVASAQSTLYSLVFYSVAIPVSLVIVS
jgi:hypothetical protein